MNKNILNILSKLLLIVSLIFITIKLKNFNINLSGYVNLHNIIMLAIAGAFLMLSVLFLSIGWNKILNYLSKVNINNSDTFPIYVKTNLAKYIPGNVMQFVGRNILGNEFGIKQKILTLSTIYELIILSTIGFSIMLITNQIKKIIMFVPKNYIYVVLGLVGCGCILFLALIIRKRIVIKKNKLIELLIIFQRSFMLYFIALIFIGISFIIVMLTVYEYKINIVDIINWVGIYILGWFVGFITPGAPGGLGIREAVLVLYMNKLIPSEYILEAVLIHRLINVISDISIYFIDLVIFKIINIKVKEEKQ